MDECIKQLHLQAGFICGQNATCGDKINYGSESSAVRAAQSMNASGKARHVVEPYPCAYCEGWHIGRVMTEEEMQIIIARESPQEH